MKILKEQKLVLGRFSLYPLEKNMKISGIVNMTLYDLQTLYIQAQEQALKNWFDDVVKSMEAVDLKRSIKQLSDSPHFIDHTKEIPAVIKAGLDTS